MKISFKSVKSAPKEHFSLGLDIGTHAIKAVKLKKTENLVELAGFCLEPVELELPEILKKIRQSQGVDTVNIGFSGPATVIRQINFPRMNSDELKQALKFEAQKNIPFAINEVSLDGCILKPDMPENKMLVLIAAVKKDLLNQRLKLCEDAGFKVNVVDLDSLALTNAFNYNYSDDENIKNKTAGLLNIGSGISNLNILEEQSLRLSRDIQIAGKEITQKISDILGLDFKAAEGLKLNPEKEKAVQMNTALQSIIANLASDVRNSFDYYESQSSSAVSRVFLSGGAARFAGLKDALANLLGIEVECWDPFKKITLAADIDTGKIKSLSAQFAVAAGLALRS